MTQLERTWKTLSLSLLSALPCPAASHETTQSRRKLTQKGGDRKKIFDHFSISDEWRRSSGSSRGLPYLASNYLDGIRGHAQASGDPARERINIRHCGFMRVRRGFTYRKGHVMRIHWRSDSPHDQLRVGPWRGADQLKEGTADCTAQHVLLQRLLQHSLTLITKLLHISFSLLSIKIHMLSGFIYIYSLSYSLSLNFYYTKMDLLNIIFLNC